MLFSRGGEIIKRKYLIALIVFVVAITFCGAAAAEEQNNIQDTQLDSNPQTVVDDETSPEDTSVTTSSTQNTVQNTPSNTNQGNGETQNTPLASTMASTDGTPKIVITFDDGLESTYTVAYPIMQQYGIKGTVYVNPAWIGAPGYLTQAQLTALHNAGWTIANHSWDHPALPSLTEAQMTTEIQTAIDYLNNNGFSDGAYHFAYPYGQYNNLAIQVCGDLGIKTARTVNWGTVSPTGNTDYLELPIILIRSDTTRNDWQSELDNSIAQGGTSIILLHDIVTSIKILEDVTVASFTEFIQYVAQTGVSTLTINQWYNEPSNPGPVAAFTATPATGTVPLQVQFTDQSTGSPTSYQWDFDNNGVVDSTAKNPTYTYSAAGTYTVKLTVTNSDGSDSIIKTNYITVNYGAPVANFVATPTSGTVPLQVQFTDQSTGSSLSYSWDFNNDGIVDSTAKNPSYVYNAAGTYTVKLTVTGAGGSSEIVKSSYITVKAPIIIPGSTQIISTTPSGGSANNNSNNAKTSADGRYIVYESTATNLVSGDTNGVSDIFLYDTVTKTTIRANRGPNGAQANGGSYNPSISADGRYIVYESDATNLVSGDGNGVRDIFLYDTITKTTIRANRGPASAQATGGGSFNAAISSDGRYIVYESDAKNLVSGDGNGVRDIFLYDKTLNKTIRANRGPSSAQALNGGSFNPSISADGRYIVYESDATNLVSGDNNSLRDVFLYDKLLNKTIRANRGVSNAQAVGGASKNASISADGRYIVYESTATNLVSGDNNGLSDIFVYDRVLNKTIRANRGAGNAQAVGGGSFNAAISADGRYVVYESDATNLVSGDTNGVRDIFRYDMVLNKTIRVNRGPGNAQIATAGSFNPFISRNGAYIAYESDATDIVSGDSNGKRDIFLYPV